MAGDSMQPTLREGQTVLVDPRAYRAAPPPPGDVVVAEHPLEPGVLLVKRMQGLMRGGAFLVGDSPMGTTDSRDFGPVPLERLLGRVVCVLT